MDIPIPPHSHREQPILSCRLLGTVYPKSGQVLAVGGEVPIANTINIPFRRIPRQRFLVRGAHDGTHPVGQVLIRSRSGSLG